MKPAIIARIHAEICRREKCEHFDKLDYFDPCVACPNGHFGVYSRKLCAGGIASGASHRDAATMPKRAEPRAQPWPLALLPLKLLAQEGDRGAGDIIARTIGPIGGDAFKVWYKRLFGKDCGCGARQDVLNARYPI